MPTEASQRALHQLRDLSTVEWYVIPLLSIVMYIYTLEIKKARESGSWDAIVAGLTLFGMDFINETWNGWVFHLTQHSACWTTPGPTGLRTMVGWNIEIMFMFALAGLIFYHSFLPDKKTKILGLPNRWFLAIAYSIFCVFVECLLNMGGHLVWEYPFWNRSFGGVWLIFFFGYFHFYAAVNIVLGLKQRRHRIYAVSGMYALATVANVVAIGLLGWQY